jgi:hypothetical protein
MNLLNVHGKKAGMTSHPKRPRDPNQLAKAMPCQPGPAGGTWKSQRSTIIRCCEARRGVQSGAVAGQLLNVVVDRTGQVLVWDAHLCIEDQVMPEASKLLKVRGDGNSP